MLNITPELRKVIDDAGHRIERNREVWMCRTQGPHWSTLKNYIALHGVAVRLLAMVDEINKGLELAINQDPDTIVNLIGKIEQSEKRITDYSEFVINLVVEAQHSFPASFSEAIDRLGMDNEYQDNP